MDEQLEKDPTANPECCLETEDVDSVDNILKSVTSAFDKMKDPQIRAEVLGFVVNRICAPRHIDEYWISPDALWTVNTYHIRRVGILPLSEQVNFACSLIHKYAVPTENYKMDDYIVTCEPYAIDIINEALAMLAGGIYSLPERSIHTADAVYRLVDALRIMLEEEDSQEHAKIIDHLVSHFANGFDDDYIYLGREEPQD